MIEDVSSRGLALVGVAAMVMHLAWSSGFWLHVLQRPFRRGTV